MAEARDPPDASASLALARPSAADPAAHWFAALRELGEVVDLRALYFETATSEPRRWVLPHESYDGTRMLQFILHEVRGATAILPAPKQTRPPSFFARIAAFLRQALARPRPLVRPRTLVPGARGDIDAPLGYELIDRDEVSAIAKRADELGASLNAHLLWALDRAVYGQLAEPNPWHAWTLSVNMRGAVGELDELPNVVVAIAIDLAEKGSPRDARDAMRAALRGNAHWGAWYALRLLNAFGERRIRRFAAKFNARPRPVSMGTFSSVGPLEVEDAGWICCVPPVMRTHPVAAGAVNTGGRLALAIQTHPILGPVDATVLATRWRDYARGTLVE